MIENEITIRLNLVKPVNAEKITKIISSLSKFVMGNKIISMEWEYDDSPENVSFKGIDSITDIITDECLNAFIIKYEPK